MGDFLSSIKVCIGLSVTMFVISLVPVVLHHKHICEYMCTLLDIILMNESNVMIHLLL